MPNNLRNRAEEAFDDTQNVDFVPATTDSVSETAGSSSSRVSRGFTRGELLDRRVRKHGRVNVRFSEEYEKAIGEDANTFSTQIGVLVRESFPVRISEWTEITDEMKELVKQKLLIHFNIDLESRVVNKSIETVMQNVLKEHRYELYKHYRNLPEDQRRIVPHKRVADIHDWEFLCNKWESPEWLEKTKRGKAARAALPYNHRAGNRSFVSIIEKKREEDGVEMGPIEVFQAVRYKEGDGWVNDTAAQVHSKMVDLQQSSTAEGAEPLTQADICETVLGRRTDGVRGMCFMPSSKRGKSSSSSTSTGVSLRERELNERVTSLTIDNQELRESVANLREEITEREAATQRQMAEMQAQMQAQIQAQIQSQLAELLHKMNQGGGSSK